MRLHIMPACAALAAAAMAVSGLVYAPAASADSGDITISSVSGGTPPQGNAGLMTVDTLSGSPITYLAVHLYDPAGNLKLTVPSTDFQLTGPPGNEELWTVKSPITTSPSGGLPGLAPGTYTAKVDATDTAGAETGLDGGTFSFLIQPFVTLSATPSSISYTQQTIKFSGQATDVVPGTTSTQPFAGQQVQIAGPTGSYPVATDKNGRFQFSLKAQADNYYSHIPASASTASAQSPLVTITDSPTPIRLAVRFTRNVIEYGHTAEMTGTLRYYQSHKTLKPLPGAKVTITRLSPPSRKKIIATTNSAGQFRAKIPRQTTTGTWAAAAGGTALLGLARVTRTLTVHQTTGFKRTSITLGGFHGLTVKTCLLDTSPGRSRTLVNAPVTLQYRRGTKGPWRQLVTIKPTYGEPYCPDRLPLWTIKVKAPAENAYYRLRFAGNQTFRVSVSKVRHLWREDTRITSFKVSPRHVKANGAISISGRLWRVSSAKNTAGPSKSGRWTPYAGRKLKIIFIMGGSEYAFTSEPKTNSKGYFSGLFTAYGTAQWLAQYAGDKTHFGTTTNHVKVKVSGRSGKLLELRRLVRAGVLLG